MRPSGLTGEYGRDAARACQGDVDHEVMARERGDFQQLLMQRIAGERSFGGTRIAHEQRTVQPLDRFLAGQADRNEFASAGEARHQVGLNEPKRDMQIGFHKPPVDMHRRA